MAKFAEMESPINTISKGTTIKGSISAVGDFRLDGILEGNISVKELLALNSTANVKGDILINRLSIEPGATFSGTCRMLDEVRRERESDKK